MKIYDIKEPKRTDTKIDFENFINLVQAVNALQNMNFDPRYFDSSLDRSGFYVTLRRLAEAFPWDKLSFGYSLSGSICTIYAGALRIHGTGLYPVAQTDVTLTGATEWVYLNHARDHSSTSLAHSATEPESTTVDLRIPLYKFTATAGVYSLAQICNMGDINIDVPLR